MAGGSYWSVDLWDHVPFLSDSHDQKVPETQKSGQIKTPTEQNPKGVFFC